MVKGLVEQQSLMDIGDAIREKNGSNEVYYPSEMASAILAIPTGNKFLTLISPTQYVTSSESFSLYAILVGDDGVGISGKIITLTGSDNSVYSAITNNNGIATFIISNISENVTFTASYEDLTATCNVECVLFYDKGSSTHHKDNYTNTGFTRSFHEDYTTLTETTSGVSGTYKSVSFPQDCRITLEIKCDGAASNSFIRLFNGDTALGNGSFANVGLTQDGQFHQYTITCTSDGRAVLSSPETQTTLTRTYTPFTGNISFGFWSSGDTVNISFKNVVIKSL